MSDVVIRVKELIQIEASSFSVSVYRASWSPAAQKQTKTLYCADLISKNISK